MDKKEIEFTIGLHGEISMEVINMKGEACKVATKEIEEALAKAGAVKVSSGDKPELFETDVALSASNDLYV